MCLAIDWFHKYIRPVQKFHRAHIWGLSDSYAHDFKIFSRIHGLDDWTYLQNRNNDINIWCLWNKLQWYADKCKIVFYSRKRIKIPYKINNYQLKICLSITDLGGTFDSKLTVKCHISLKTSEALRSNGFCIQDCKEFIGIRTLKI